MDKEPIIEAAGTTGNLKRALKTTFSSLKHRNYRLYFTGQVVSNTGNWLTNVALTLLVLKLTGSGFTVGLLAACQYGPILLLSIWGGAIADRFSKRKLLLITQSLEMAQSVALAIMAFQPHPSVTALFIIATAGGIFLAIDNPVRRSFVSEMVPKKDIANAVVIYSTIVNLSRVIGPSLAGVLVVTVGYGWAFTVDAASYIAVIASLVLMRPSELFLSPPVKKMKGAVRAGFRYVTKQPMLWISLMMLAIIGTISYNFGITLPLFVSGGLHKADTTYTILYSAMGVGSVIAALIVAHRKLTRLRHTIIGAAALGVTTILLGMASNLVLASALSFLVGAASIIYSTSTTALVQLESAPNMRGRVLSMQTILLMGTTPIGGPILGWVSDSLGGRAPLYVGGIAALAAAAIGFYAATIASNSRKNPSELAQQNAKAQA